VVATTIHRESRRASGPFKAVDCGSIPPTLIESELFGHEKGAFTGADRARPGCFEDAAEGTLFLDEIGNLPMAMQAKLLRALQERQIYRVGGNTPIPLNVRVLTATNEDLTGQVEAGLFRRDLYYRLDEFGIRVPPLRERDEDILFLAHRFLQAVCLELCKSVLGITKDATQMLRAYPWPGNVRELRNFIRRAALFAEEPISCEHLRLAGLAPIVMGCACQPQHDLTGALSFRELIRAGIIAMEREILLQVLEQSGGNMKQAARFLRLDYKTLRNKAKQYNLKTPPLPEESHRETVAQF
jgi:two-component system nitrogen regulation response regulator GlnG